jgi:hypothetical protein
MPRPFTVTGVRTSVGRRTNKQVGRVHLLSLPNLLQSCFTPARCAERPVGPLQTSHPILLCPPVAHWGELPANDRRPRITDRDTLSYTYTNTHSSDALTQIPFRSETESEHTTVADQIPICRRSSQHSLELTPFAVAGAKNRYAQVRCGRWGLIMGMENLTVRKLLDTLTRKPKELTSPRSTGGRFRLRIQPMDAKGPPYQDRTS